MKTMKTLFAILFALTFCLQQFPTFAAAPAGFVETDITPPKTVGEQPYPIALFMNNDGSIDYYVEHMSYDAPTVMKKYTSKDNGKTWTDADCGWALAISQKHGLDKPRAGLTDDMVMDSEGNLYFATNRDKDGLPHAYKVKKDGTFKEISIPSWQKDHNQVFVNPVGLASDNSLLFAHMTPTMTALLEKIDPETGALKQRIVDDAWQPTAFCGDTAVMGGMYNVMSFYDMNTGKLLRNTKLPKAWQSDVFKSKEILVELDQDGTTYLVSRNGVERLPKDASVFENVMDATRYHFGDKSCSFRKFYKQPGKNVFYIVAMMDRDLKLYRYEAPGV